jgi:hypothetical protein
MNGNSPVLRFFDHRRRGGKGWRGCRAEVPLANWITAMDETHPNAVDTHTLISRRCSVIDGSRRRGWFSPAAATSEVVRRPSPLTTTAIHRSRHNAPTLAHLQVGRVDPQIGPVAFKRAAQEGFYLLVDLLSLADLALGDAGHAHGLDQIIDRAGRDAVYVGFLHHCGQRLLR